MAAKKPGRAEIRGGTLIQLNLVGLVIFTVSLVLAAGGLTYFLTCFHAQRNGGQSVPTGGQANSLIGAGGVQAAVPWGELLTFNIELEMPEEYAAFEAGTNRAPQWVFPGLTPASVRGWLADGGLTPNEVEHALTAAFVSTTDGRTVVRPDDDFILNLRPAVREKLYERLADFPENHYMKFPFTFSGQLFENIAAEDNISPATVALVRKLLYPRGRAQCFSDVELVLRRLPTEEERTRLIKVFSRQPTVLARLQVRPDADIDKILGYWAAPSVGVRVKDVRPLLESLQRLPDGGSVSVLYLLPQFARQRLYTFPLPSSTSDPTGDCLWTTMNFFNETPDNQFTNFAYLDKYVSAHYYTIAKPTAYGDILFLQDAHGTVLHSAVQLADDLVFTKSGRGALQPWVIMHLPDLQDAYSADPGVTMKVFRNRDN